MCPMRRIREGLFSLRAGLIAGSAAAIVAALVNLPLHSPSDAYINSATVMIGSLATGLGAGLAWALLGRAPGLRSYHPAVFGVCMVLASGLVSLIAWLAESQVDRAVSYLVPLAVLVFGITGSLTFLLLRIPQVLAWRVVLIAVIIAAGLGIGLAGQGDQKGGGLELPPRAMTEVSLETFFEQTTIGAGNNETRECPHSLDVIGRGLSISGCVGSNGLRRR